MRKLGESKMRELRQNIEWESGERKYSEKVDGESRVWKMRE